MNGVVVFDPAEFKEMYPQFAEATDASLQTIFGGACLLLDNTPSSIVTDLTERKTLLYMLTCHIATLKENGNFAAGIITSASEGKVSVSMQPFQNANWYMMSPCGLMYWQATAKYRVVIRYNGYCPSHRGR